MPYAILFPGQGSQAGGMAEGLADDPLFGVATDLLGADFRALDAEALTRTENAQPALFVTSFLRWRESGLDQPAFVAGHSLGEYAAVAVAGALDCEAVLRLVVARGRAMGGAGRAHPGTMAALLGATLEEAEALCAQRSELWVANDNAPGQVVVGGSEADVEWVTGQVRRARRLQVSGAFHTPFMAPAAEELSRVIDEAPFTDPAVPVVVNADAAAVTDAAAVADALRRQLLSRVRWTESVQAMAAAGVDQFVCIGPGDAVAGMVRRIAPEVEVKGL